MEVEQRNLNTPPFGFAYNLRLTLKAWPVITAVTIGLCYLTQVVAKVVFGVDLPEQEQLQVVRQMAGWNWPFVKLVLGVLIVAPVFEETLFRLLLFKLPAKAFGFVGRRGLCRTFLALVALLSVVSSAIFSTAHYPNWTAIASEHRMVWLPLSNAFLALWFFGLAQCWLYWRTTWLWSPILNHLLFNLTNLVLLFLVPAQA